MMTAEQNYRLLQEIEANRQFLLAAYQQNPKLLERAETRIREMFEISVQHEHRGANMMKQRGISLVELVMFIVIISIALVGIMLVMNQTIGHSADTLVRKQAMTVAESLLEEIEGHAFSGGICVGTLGPNAARSSVSTVCDYKGYTSSGVQDYYTNHPVSGLESYNIAVDVTSSALSGIPATSAVIITVQVTPPAGKPVDAAGYRAAY